MEVERIQREIAERAAARTSPEKKGIRAAYGEQRASRQRGCLRERQATSVLASRAVGFEGSQCSSIARSFARSNGFAR